MYNTGPVADWNDQSGSGRSFNGVGGSMTPAVQWLLAINVVVYFLQLTIFGLNTVAGWFALIGPIFPEQWWGVATYMFVHGGVMHLVLNMLMLWMFGRRLEASLGTRSFLWFYVWCGLGGAVFHLLFARSGVVVGASGAVVGVVLAYALRWPNDDVYLFGVFPMKTRWLAIGTIVWNVVMALSDMSGTTHSGTAWMAHVGGLAFAWLYLQAPLVGGGGLDRIRQRVSMVPDEEFPRPVPRGSRGKSRGDGKRRDMGSEIPLADRVIAQSKQLLKERSRRSAVQQLDRPRVRLEDIDAILDKISLGGLESLSDVERDALERFSRGE